MTTGRQEIPTLTVVDSHVHFWRRTPDGEAHLDPRDAPLTSESLVRLMDAAKVSTTLQLSRVYEQDDDYSIQGAMRHSGRIYVIGRSPRASFTDPTVLRQWYARSHVVGMRLFDAPFPAYLFGNAGDPYWREVADLKIPVSIYAPDFLPRVGSVAARHGDVTFVIEHAAVLLKPGTPRDSVFRHWDDLRLLSRWPNVFVKASALPEVTDEDFPYPAAQSRLRELVAVFGADHVMWGSNFTGSIRQGAYADQVEFARLSVSPLSPSERESVLAGTARRIFHPRPAA